MSVDLTALFRVGYTDFVGIWKINEPLDWCPPFEVREQGIFIPTPQHATQLTPAELAAVSHPTGNPEEAILPFPCSLQQMFVFLQDGGIGACSNLQLIAWMRARVENLRNRTAWLRLNSIADVLFLVTREEAKQLVPQLRPDASQITFPCAIDVYLDWCEDELAPPPRPKRPSNDAVVGLVCDRLAAFFEPGIPACDSEPLSPLRRSGMTNIILALRGEGGQSDQPDWDSMNRGQFLRNIKALCLDQRISIQKGRGGVANIVSLIVTAHQKGWITSNSPAKDTVGKILNEIRESQNSN